MTARVVTASASARVDLAGGWTDVAPYTTEVGGAVCNIAIELRARATVRAETTDGELPLDPLVRAAWERAGRPAVSVSLETDIPMSSGLGGSSAAGVALAAALATWRGAHLTAHDLAELSRATETETLGLAGGCQDHYAAAFGGALLLWCNARTVAKTIELSEKTIAAFENQALIAYTGESRMSSDTINAVLNAYRDGEAVTCASLAVMASLAPRMADALGVGDIDHLGRLVAAQWEAQRSLHPTITTPLIDRIVADVADAGALGSKALGASGGGCVLVIAPTDRVEAVRSALESHAQMLPLKIATGGVQFDDSGTQERTDAVTARREN